MAAAPPPAPPAITHPQDLPDDIRALLAGHGIDFSAIDQALLDAQGQWLLFETTQALTRADANGTSDIYRLDLLTATLRLLSRTPRGIAGNGPSRYPTADASGELVVFQSDAPDLVADDDNGVSDIFLHEVPLALTRRLTTAARQGAAHPALDAAGEDLIYDQGPLAGPRAILVDGLWGDRSPAPLSLERDEAGRVLDNHHSAISADGRYLAYREARPGAAEERCQVHFLDRDTGRFQRQPCPTPLATAPEEARPAFSADGTEVEWYRPFVEEEGLGAAVRVGNPPLEPRLDMSP
jgi:Tol biopolymer transport system component